MLGKIVPPSTFTELSLSVIVYCKSFNDVLTKFVTNFVGFLFCSFSFWKCCLHKIEVFVLLIMHVFKERKRKTILSWTVKGRKFESQHRWLKGLILFAIAFSVKN